MKITILGLPGSGKTTLAEKISKKENIKYINIDNLWVMGGGGYNSKTTPDPQKTYDYLKEKVTQEIEKDSWVSDGFYPGIQKSIADKADTIIFLDIPTYIRLMNHLKRTVGNGKEGMNLIDNLKFFFEMLGKGSVKRKKVENFLNEYENKTLVFKSHKESEAWLNT